MMCLEQRENYIRFSQRVSANNNVILHYALSQF